MIIQKNLNIDINREIILNYLSAHTWKETCKKFNISVATISRLKNGQDKTIINYKRKTINQNTNFELNKYYQTIKNVTYKCMNDEKYHSEQDDIFQEVLLEIYLKSNYFLSVKNKIAWIYSVACIKIKESKRKYYEQIIPFKYERNYLKRGG